MKVTCLLCYCSEGDNMADAFNLADAACKFLRLNPDNVRGEFWIFKLDIELYITYTPHLPPSSK